jgi:hypothetical protein
MFRNYCRTIVVLAAIGIAGRTAVDLAAQSRSTADLTGTWVLNAGLSDRPGQSAGDQGGRPDGGGRRGPGGGGMGRPGGMGGSGGRRGGRSGGGGDMPDREDMERMRAAMDAVRRTPARLIIVTGEPGLIITDDEGVSTRLALNGSKETGAINGVPFESTAKWEERKLRVEKKFKGGLKVVELYSVSADPRLLTVSTKIEGGGMRGGGRTMNRVYDHHEPEAR